VSSILTVTAIQSLSPLADCSVNATLVKVVPFLKQSFFQRINVDPEAVHTLLQNVPDCSRRLTETIGQVFLGNFLSNTKVSLNCETFNYSLYSFDNILLICLSAHKLARNK